MADGCSYPEVGCGGFLCGVSVTGYREDVVGFGALAVRGPFVVRLCGKAL